MRTAPLHAARGLVAAAFVAALVVAAGCDWLKSSGPGTRFSPFLSSLSVENAGGTLCGPTHPFEISFRYDDPQDDLFETVVTFTHQESQSVIEHRVPWSLMDVERVPGRAITSTFLACGSDTGTWQVTVQVEDAEGHTSNVLTGSIELISR